MIYTSFYVILPENNLLQLIIDAAILAIEFHILGCILGKDKPFILQMKLDLMMENQETNI